MPEGGETDQVFRFARADGKGQPVSMKVGNDGAKTTVDTENTPVAKAETVTVVEARRYLGMAPVSGNAQANGVGERCRFLRSDATEYMDATVRADRPDDRFDVVVMDPPRAGSTPKFLAGVSRLGPSRIAYVSCNVITQARDITILRDYGYRLERVTPVDMFPHTTHVEAMAIFDR